MKRIGTLVLAAPAVFFVALSHGSPASAQDIVQKEEPKQSLTIIYPGDGIVLSGTGDNEIRYKGLIYVKVYPVSPNVKEKHGDGPIFSDEINPVTRFTSGEADNPSLPLGEYEVRFSMRTGKTLRTCIKKDILLTTNGGTNVTAEMSGDAQTLVIGGGMTVQQMEDAIKQLQQQVIALQAEIAALKAK